MIPPHSHRSRVAEIMPICVHLQRRHKVGNYLGPVTGELPWPRWPFTWPLVGIYHGPRHIAAQTQDPLHSQSASPCLLAGHQPYAAKPQRERLMCILKDSPGCDGCLEPARTTHYQAPLCRPSPGIGTPRAYKPVRPPKLEEVLTTTFFRSKLTFKLQKGVGIVIHPAILLRQITGVK